MEITCTRCRETLHADNRYCPACGLPQLVYSAEAAPGQAQPARWDEGVRDASSVDWKPALRAALMLAVPAGLFSSVLSPLSSLGMFWMAAAAAWTVVLYVRSQRPAWITIGAGARIGLVTGILGGWLAFGASGSTLFVERVVLHQASQRDAEWKTSVEATEQVSQDLAARMGPAFAAQEQANRAQNHAWMLSPEGHAGSVTFDLASYSVLLLLFAVAGGALGARWMARTRQPEV
jgi:hypothetical protein